MSASLISLIVQLAPIAAKWGTVAIEAMISAIKSVAPPEVTVEQIRTVFLAFHQYASLSDFEKEAGVIVNPDGSVSPQPPIVPTIATPATESTDVG